MSGGGDKGAKKAAREQTRQLQMGIDEQRAAYADAQGLFAPYMEIGNNALSQYAAMLGLSGNDAQQQAMTGLAQTPGFQAQLSAGQDAILQNAAATGGLRGGNVQQGLADFSSNLFGQYYQNQLQQLGGLQQQGFNTATNLANVRAGTAGGISNAYSQIGDARAQAALAGQGGGLGGAIGGGLSGAAQGAMVGSVVPGIGTAVGAGVGGVMGMIGGGK